VDTEVVITMVVVEAARHTKPLEVVEATKTMVEEETGTISGMQIMYMINPL
jgi:hypothetical protein